jgi:hypothetical protein
MKKKMLALTCIVLTLFIVLSTVGCQKNDVPSNSINPNQTETVAKGPKTKLDIYHMVSWNASPNKNGEVIKWLNNYLNTELTITIDAAPNPPTFQTWLATGEWPGVIADRNNAFWRDTFASGGKLIDLTKYFNDPVNYPNLAKVPKTIQNNAKDVDGRIVYFPLGFDAKQLETGKPSLIADQICTATYYVRTDVLKTLGLSHVPQTLDEVTQYLRLVKEKGLKSPAGTPMIPLGFRSEGWFSWKFFGNWWGDGWQGITKEGAYLPWFNYSKGIYNAAKWLNELYRESLVDKEWFTQKPETAEEKMANGTYAMIYPGAQPVDQINANMKNQGWDIAYEPIPIPTVPGVDEPASYAITNPYAFSVIYVTESCKNPDTVAKLADWLVSTEGARCASLQAVPSMIELKESGPHTGSYWYKDEYSELDYLLHSGDELTQARIKHGGNIFVGEYFSALRVDLKELQIPNEITESQEIQLEWTKTVILNGGFKRIPPDYLGAGTGSTRMSELNSIITGPVYSLQQQALVANTAEEFQKYWDQAWDKFIQLDGKEYIEEGTRLYWEWIKKNPGTESQFPYEELYKDIPDLKIEK